MVQLVEVVEVLLLKAELLQRVVLFQYQVEKEVQVLMLDLYLVQLMGVQVEILVVAEVLQQVLQVVVHTLVLQAEAEMEMHTIKQVQVVEQILVVEVVLTDQQVLLKEELMLVVAEL